jgi:hypothetical protein
LVNVSNGFVEQRDIHEAGHLWAIRGEEKERRRKDQFEQNLLQSGVVFVEMTTEHDTLRIISDREELTECE